MYKVMESYSKQLHLKKGEKDWDGRIFKEDRYIIVDSEGFDAAGSHMTEQEADDLIEEYNNEK